MAHRSPRCIAAAHKPGRLLTPHGLNAGVAPAQVAEWAGHSVAILLRIYAKCISGQQDEAMRRIFDATQDEPPEPDEDHGQNDDEPQSGP